jgi:hypothetical protein
MPPNCKFLAARLREKRKRAFQEPNGAANEAADPSAAAPSLDNKVLNAVNVAPLTQTGVLVLNAGDLHGVSPFSDAESDGISGFCDQTISAPLAAPNFEKSPQNVQAFGVAQSSGAFDNVVMGDGLDLEVCESIHIPTIMS